MTDTITKPSHSIAHEKSQNLFGSSLALKGELTGDEDLLVEGTFEGTINLQGHCLTVGANGQVKADIRAGRVVILGSVSGNISCEDRIEIRKTGHVIGDLVGPGIAIEDGAYFKGTIEIVRPDTEARQAPKQAPTLATLSATQSST